MPISGRKDNQGPDRLGLLIISEFQRFVS